MRPGGGASKGGAYERKLARALSTWWYGGPNYLWRRPGSGYRVNMSNRHTGDIVPIADSGSLPGPWIFHVEAKCYSKKRLKLANLLWPKRSPIRKIWNKALSEKRSDLIPLLILKSNNSDPVGVIRLADLRPILQELAVAEHTPRTFFEAHLITTDDKNNTLLIFPWLDIQKFPRVEAKKK